MRPPLSPVMDSPRTRDLKEMRRKRLEYFCRSQPPDDNPTRIQTTITGPTTEDRDDQDTPASSAYIDSRIANESSDLELEEAEERIWTKRPRPVQQRTAVSQSLNVTEKNIEDLVREDRRTGSPDDLETLSQPCLDFEDEMSEVEIGSKLSHRATPRSFTNVSKMWDSIMLRHLGESADGTEMSDDRSEISGMSDYTLAPSSTNVSNAKISIASTHTIVKSTAAVPAKTVQPRIETIETNSTDSELRIPHLLETCSDPPTKEKPSIVHDILTSPQNDITTAMVKLGISNNSYIEGYLKGLRHALGRDAFLQVVETSPDLREIIDSMLLTQRSSVRKGPVSKSFSGPFSTEDSVGGPTETRRPNEYKDIDTRFVEPIESWNKPGPSGDAKSRTVERPLVDTNGEQRQRPRETRRPNEYKDIDTRFVEPIESWNKPGPSGDAKSRTVERPLVDTNGEQRQSPRETRRPNEYKDIDTRFVEPIESWNKPGPSGDAKSRTPERPAETNGEQREQRQRVVFASCAFSADEIYRQAKDLSLKESVGRKLKLDRTIVEEKTRGSELNTRNPRSVSNVQYQEPEDAESTNVERSRTDKREGNSSVRTGISRDAKLWRDSDKKVEQPSTSGKPPSEAQATKSQASQLLETSSLKRYFTSLERLNLHGQSINYTEVSAHFEPLPEWATPRDGGNIEIAKDRLIETTNKKGGHSSLNVLEDDEELATPRSLLSNEPRKLKKKSGAAITEKVLRPAQSSSVPTVHSTLPPSLSYLVQSSQDDLEGNFKAFQSYDNYMTQLRASWKDTSIFQNERSMDDFLEKIASKSGNMNDFIRELRTSFDVRKSRDYDVTPVTPATAWLRKSMESHGTDSGTHVTGLTGKLNKIGVDWTLIRQDLITDQNRRASVGGASFRGPDGRSFVVTCPECGTNNRPYVTWCLDCGCVLIGVEPTETRKSAAAAAKKVKDAIKVKDVQYTNDLKSELANGTTNAKVEIITPRPKSAISTQRPKSANTTPRPKSARAGKGQEFAEPKNEISWKSAKQSAPPVSGNSPRRRPNRKISNPELAIHLSVSSSVDRNTATSLETPEIEVLPRLSTVSAVKSSIPIPSLDLRESSDYQRPGLQSPEMISMGDSDSDDDTARNELPSNGEIRPSNEPPLHSDSDDDTDRNELPSNGEILPSNESLMPGNDTANGSRNVPDDFAPLLSDRSERVDASTSTDAVHPLEQRLQPPKVATYLIHSPSMTSQRPATAGNAIGGRPSLSKEQRPLSAGTRGKKVGAKSVERRRKPEGPRWQTASMDWYAKNKQRTSAWASAQSTSQDLRKSRTAETSQTAVVPFVPTPRADDTPRNEDGSTVAPPLVDVQNYSQRTWSPSKALCQNKEGRFAPKRPFHWTLSKDRFAQLITQSPRILTGDVSFLLSLPDELVLHILTHLPHADLVHVGRTCTTLNRLGMDESLWRVIQVHGRALTDQHLEEMGSRHPQSLDLTNCTGYDVTPSGVRALFRNSANLQCLTIAGCTGSSLTGDALIHAAASRCPNLTDVNVVMTSIGNATVTSLSQTLETLMAINLSGNKEISDETVMKICQKHGQHLESLEIAECFNITSKAVKAIGQSCKGLLTLNMGQCYKITDQCVQHLAPSLTRLQRLDLRGCKQIKDSAVRELVRHCKRLESLTLANCQGCTDLAVVEIATYLDMGGCRLVTDVGIRSLAHNCLLMTYLDLSTTGVTHKSVSMLASYCSQRLEILKMNFCRDITELSLIKLARHCRKLREIHLYGCKTAKNVDRILMENPNLSVKLLSL